MAEVEVLDGRWRKRERERGGAWACIHVCRQGAVRDARPVTKRGRSEGEVTDELNFEVTAR
jgi:hypothetical protein